MIKSKVSFQVGFMGIISATAPKISTSETNISNYILIVDVYSKIPKVNGVDKITTEN